MFAIVSRRNGKFIAFRIWDSFRSKTLSYSALKLVSGLHWAPIFFPTMTQCRVGSERGPSIEMPHLRGTGNSSLIEAH